MPWFLPDPISVILSLTPLECAFASRERRLTTQEFAVIKAHPAVGERILKPLRFLHSESCAVRSHHGPG